MDDFRLYFYFKGLFLEDYGENLIFSIKIYFVLNFFSLYYPMGLVLLIRPFYHTSNRINLRRIQISLENFPCLQQLYRFLQLCILL